MAVPSASLLIYDIPERRGIPNPSPTLLRVAFRANLSCWIIPDQDIPYALLHDLAERGVRWWTVKFDATEGEKLVRMALDSLRLECRRIIESARETQRRRMEALEETGGNDELKRFRNSAAAIVRRSRRSINQLKGVAERFGIEDNRFYRELTGAVDICQGIRTAMHERAAAYVQAINQMREINTSESAVFIAQMERGEMPMGVAADWLDENSPDGDGGQRIRAAFQDDLFTHGPR